MFRNPGDAFYRADRDLIGLHPPSTLTEDPFTFLGVIQGTGKGAEIEGVEIEGVEIGA